MKDVVSDDSSPTSEHPAHELPQGELAPRELPSAGGAQPASSGLELTEAGSFGLPGSVSSDSARRSLMATEGSSEELSTGLHLDLATGDIERDPTVISQRPVAVPADFARSLSLIELARSLEGRQLHHFAVGRMIGGGGMGAVFRGRDLRLDRDVAIKVIPESRRDPETLRRFRMEAQSAARLDHPNIARVYDIGEDEAWNYIVFEFIDGINLRDLVQMEGPLSIDDAVFTTRQVAEALQHAHDRDVVHRDIKPSNVIITPTGIAKVVDMGLARNTALDRSAADQTASGVTLGTFDYISPEQARDPRDADVRSDLYSLGCTLFYMLTGQPPFPEGTALQKLLNHGSQPPPDPRQWRDDISDQLYAVLAKLMAKRPADRYQKPLELINDLLLIAQLEGLPRSRSPGSILMRPTVAQRTLLETHLPWLVPMAVLLLSAFWMQSADSLSSSLELPIPTFLRATQSAVGPPASRPDASSRSASDGSNHIPPDPLLPPIQDASPATAPPASPATSSPSGSDGPRVIEPPAQAETFDAATAIPSASGLRSAPGAGATLGTGPVVPLASESRQALDLSPKAVTASAAVALSNLRDRISTSPTPGAAPTAATGAESPASSAPALASTAGSSNVSSASAAGPSIEGNIEPRLPSPMARDTIVISRTEPADLNNGALWSASLSEGLTRAAMVPEVRVIELRDSVELNHAIAIPRSGLTLRAAHGRQVRVVLNGEQAYGMGWESWIDVQRVAFRCERIEFICRNNMHQPQAIFALRAGGQLELVECVATMESNRGAPLGSCVLVSEPDRQRERGVALGASSATANDDGALATFIPGSSSTQTSSTPTSSSPAMPALADAGTSATPPPPANSSGSVGASSNSPSGNTSSDAEPVAVTLRDCLVRGNQNLVAMRTACRAEITLDETCAVLEGRVLVIRGLEQDRMPPVVRLNMQLSTLVCRQGFALIQTGFALRAPLTLMRTARLCAFWSPSMVPHIMVDGIADQGALDELLQLRGEDNGYDQNIETLCQCRFADGKHIDFSFRDATGEWFRERADEHSLRWQNAVPPDRPLDAQMPEDYRLRDGMYMPGFPPAAGAPPRLESEAQD